MKKRQTSIPKCLTIVVTLMPVKIPHRRRGDLIPERRSRIINVVGTNSTFWLGNVRVRHVISIRVITVVIVAPPGGRVVIVREFLALRSVFARIAIVDTVTVPQYGLRVCRQWVRIFTARLVLVIVSLWRVVIVIRASRRRVPGVPAISKQWQRWKVFSYGGWTFEAEKEEIVGLYRFYNCRKLMKIYFQSVATRKLVHYDNCKNFFFNCLVSFFVKIPKSSRLRL